MLSRWLAIVSTSEYGQLTDVCFGEHGICSSKVFLLSAPSMKVAQFSITFTTHSSACPNWGSSILVFDYLELGMGHL